MSDLINGKFHNAKFVNISSSVDFSSGRDYKDQHRIPHRLKHGASSKENNGFFDEVLITDEDHLRIVKLDGQFNYVGLRNDKYKIMVDNFMSSSASSTAAYQQMSASFFDSGGFGRLLSDSEFVTIIVEDGEDGIISPSYTLSSPSGIANSNNHFTVTISNNSSFNTAATWSFSPGNTHEIHQTSSISEWSHRFFFSASSPTNFNAIAISGSESGSNIGTGVLNYVNGANNTEGSYLSYLIKGKIFGDGENDSGEVSSSAFSNTSSPVFLPIREIIIYQNDTTVISGSFKYNSSSITAASSSGITTTLYYQSGSSFSGSFVGNGLLSGSHIFTNSTLTTPASSGYYAVPGTSTVLHAFRGGLNNDVTGAAAEATPTKTEYQVPRFVSKSTV
jgi:hypothetical protein